MKVCIIRNTEAHINPNVARVVDALLTDGHECVLLSRNRLSGNSDIIKKTYIHNKRKVTNYEIQLPAELGAGLKNISPLFSYMRIVYKWLIANTDLFDMVHVFDLDSGLPTYLATKKLQKQYVYHIGDFYVDSRGGIPKVVKPIVRKLEHLVINSAKTTIICTEARKEQIKGSKPQNLVVVHNVPSINISIPIRRESTNNRLKLVYVGSLSKKRFIDEMVNIIKEDNRYVLELAGLGPLEDFVKQAASSYENIIFHGKVKHEYGLELCASSDIMFAIYDPSVWNHKFSAPNKLYEAMMLGKPLIIAKGTGVDEIVRKENMGFVVEFDKNSVSKVLDCISQSPEILRHKGLNALEAYKDYNWDVMKQRIIKIYKHDFY